MKRRVVVTGLGIVSSIGNNKDEVAESLKTERSGVEFCQDYAERGFLSQVHAPLKIDLEQHIDRRLMRFMGDSAAFNYIAMQEAIADAGLEESDVSNDRTGLIMGSTGASTSNQVEAADIVRERGIKRLTPFIAPRCMSSTTSANVATAFNIKGMTYTISSACASTAHCIGNAAEIIQYGRQDVMFAGGGEELHWTLSMLLDAMGALSTSYNDTPQAASRAYDKNRDGFVISGGGGVLVLEELEHARARGARIYAEIVGYGATCNGHEMVVPDPEALVRAIREALPRQSNAKVGYINTHGTSTPAGDIAELEAIKEVFAGEEVPPISSTKSLTGHAQGAAGVHEAIYSLLMLENRFLSASVNIEELDPGAEGMPIVTERQDDVDIDCVMSNSIGFGGVNCALTFQRLPD